MRSALDLLDLPYSFTQRHLLTASDFRSAAGERGVPLSDQQLEVLHRVQVLAPVFRVRRDGRAIAAAMRRGNAHLARQLANWTPTRRADLVATHEAGQLHDAMDDGFVARRRLRRAIGDRTYETSAFLYVAHQLIVLPLVREVLPLLRLRERNGAQIGVLDTPREWQRLLRDRARELHDVAITTCALEPTYYSQVVRRLTFPDVEDFRAFEDWQDRSPATELLAWLGLEAEWLRDRAAGLLVTAQRIDQLGRWNEVVAQADPSTWDFLRGTARTEMDLRATAETLLLFYDDLAAGGAEPLPGPESRERTRFDLRLRRRRSLDALLTDFGLSPHPRVVLVVEGATERRLFPRVMRLLEVPVEDDFIAIEDAEGVDRDLSPLIAYFAPRLEESRDEPHADLVRPPTRFLVVLDPEGKAATSEQRRERRDRWIERIMRTFPTTHHTPVVRRQIALFVRVMTWKRSGESFEFAHFTDRQLAVAIERLDRRRSRKPTLVTLLTAIRGIRAASGSIKPVLDAGRISKVDLADALWPILETKLELAIKRDTTRRIPIVRVLGTALGMADELPRRNLVLELAKRPTRGAPE